MICGECGAVMVRTLQAVYIASAEIYCRGGMEARRSERGRRSREVEARGFGGRLQFDEA